MVELGDEIWRFFPLLILITVRRDSWRMLNMFGYSDYCFTNKGTGTRKVNELPKILKPVR